MQNTEEIKTIIDPNEQACYITFVPMSKVQSLDQHESHQGQDSANHHGQRTADGSRGVWIRRKKTLLCLVHLQITHQH